MSAILQRLVMMMGSEQIIVGPSGILVFDIGTHSSSSPGASINITIGAGGVPSGSLIVIAISEETGSFSGTSIGGSVTDSALNSYSGLTGLGNSGNSQYGFERIFYAYNTSALSSGDNITFHLSTSNDYVSVTAFYATGVMTSGDPLDSSVTVYTIAGAPNPTLTSGTPTISGELFVGIVGDLPGGAPAFVQDTAHGWVTPPTQSVTSVFTGIYGGTQVNAGTGTITYAPATSVNGCAMWILGFKPA